MGSLDRFFKRPSLADTLRGAGVRNDLVEAASRTVFGRPGDPGISDLLRHLSDDEAVLQLMEGRSGPTGLLVLTSQRLLFVPDGRAKPIYLQLSDITTVNSQVKRGMSRIEVSTAGETLVVDRILGNQADTLATNIRSASSAPTTANPAPQDALEELGQLRALHAAGLVDDVEYEIRKRALIDRI